LLLRPCRINDQLEPEALAFRQRNQH